jgi:biotin synthase-related radical SAM superfamily protein
MLERRSAQVHIWSIHPDIEIALFAVNPVTRKPFLGASPPPAETPGGACNPSAPSGET